MEPVVAVRPLKRQLMDPEDRLPNVSQLHVLFIHSFSTPFVGEAARSCTKIVDKK